MTKKLGEHFIGMIIGLSLLGLCLSMISLPSSILYAIWVNPEIGMKILTSAIVIFISSMISGFISTIAHDEFYEEEDE